MTRPKPIVLIVLDGWGYRKDPEYNAIHSARKPNWDDLWLHYPHTTIVGSGADVGLPNGQMGNSEVGHLHMGAGRLVPQDLMRINTAIESGDFFNNPTLLKALSKVTDNNKLHIIGLLSPGGVHSHENHINAMIELAAKQNIRNIFVHAILDGRDTPPRSALPSIQSVEKTLKRVAPQGKLASIIGRFYAMDRDCRWERVEKAYHLYTLGQANYHAPTAEEALILAYDRNENDEFVQATAIHTTELPITIDDQDVVIFMNFRADRSRELTNCFLQPDFSYFNRQKISKLQAFVSLTQYSEDLLAEVAYPPLNVTDSFGECIAKAGLSQLRIAETEKYAHVTFFFNGGQEKLFTNEDRILVPSPKVSTYDLKPEMSAYELTEQLVEEIISLKHDVIICNYANPDMVGHSGNMAATIQAIEVIDSCLGKIVQSLKEVGGEVIITADHGNAESMFNAETGQPHTAHTNNLVPFLYVGRPASITQIKGTLTDIAPTLLSLLDLPIPDIMTGRSLIKLDQ